jgi:predicted DNA-binding transcriptional regulator AlpA|uniref:Homeodomain-like domain-containing protein n=1 Tax=Leptospirillum ferriphilum TaxID=178606 RepID=A0A2I2MFF9_9BACT
MQVNLLKSVLSRIRVKDIAEACGVSPTAVQRWIDTGHLPKSEWCGETHYASKIAGISSGKITTSELLAITPVVVRLIDESRSGVKVRDAVASQR